VAPRRHALLSALALILAVLAVDAPLASAAPPPEPALLATTTLLVGRESGTSTDDVVARLDDAGIDVEATSLSRLSTTRVEVDLGDLDRAVDELGDLDGVSTVLVDQPVHAAAVTPNDPGFASQWGTRSTDVDDVWSSTTGSADTVIAVLDTGVNAVPDLAGRVLAGHDFVNDDADPSDDHGHGTDVSTIAAAAGNDGLGIAGVCWTCRVLPVKVLASNGSGVLSNVASGIVWAVDHGADVINLSLGGATNLPVVESAVNYATSHNVTVMAAAGNDGLSTPSYPAAVPGAIAVAASTLANDLYSFSNRGSSWVDVAAPGCNPSTGDGTVATFCGTSSATPLAAGIVGLLRAAHPDLGAAAIRGSLESSTTSLVAGGLAAYGVVNAAGAMQAANGVASGAAPLAPSVDVTAPSAVVLDPGGFISGIATTRVATYDDRGVASVQLYADGALVGSAAPGADGFAHVVWPAGFRDDGPVTLRATVVDGSGNSGASADLVARVDNRAPGLLLMSPGQNARVGARFGITVAAFDANDTLMTLVAVGGRVVGGSQGNGTFRFTGAVPRSGRVQVVAAAVDRAGHISFSNVVTVTATVSGRRR
jgi:hypothetical protein